MLGIELDIDGSRASPRGSGLGKRMLARARIEDAWARARYRWFQS